MNSWLSMTRRNMRQLPRVNAIVQGSGAVVTGASSGIGRAVALALAEQCGDVCLVARRRELLEEVAAEVCNKGAQGHVCCADLTSDEELSGVAVDIQRTFKGIDVLVLCGGAIFHGQLEHAPLAELDLQYRSNVRAHYALIQLLLPLVRKQQGQIVFINSSAGRNSSPGAGQFAATQHALRALADALRQEVNNDGIRVLSVYPGRTATPRMEAYYKKQNEPYRPELLMQPQDVAAMVVAALNIPRTAEVTDISMRPMRKSY
jgi:NADP-dependent 3-hydroxy acid dehydrogenase YdfG